VPNVERYDAVAIAQYWSIAALILAAFGPKEWTGALTNVHALTGLAVLVLTIARPFWRLSHPPS